MSGRFEESLPHFQAYVREHPDEESGHGSLGNVYAAFLHGRAIIGRSDGIRRNDRRRILIRNCRIGRPVLRSPVAAGLRLVILRTVGNEKDIG